MPFVSFATTGGDYELVTLGADESGIYFLHYYHDESDRAPALWKYNFDSNKISQTYDWSNYPKESIEDGIIRMGWDNLSKISMDNSFDLSQIQMLELAPIKIFDKFNEEYYSVFPYQVQFGNQQITLNQCYSNKSTPTIVELFTLNDIHFVHLRYLGLCYEGGYNKDTVFAFNNTFASAMVSDSINEPALGAIEIADSLYDQNQEKNDTYWEKGSPNYIYVFLPIILILLPILILKWKKKDTTNEK